MLMFIAYVEDYIKYQNIGEGMRTTINIDEHIMALAKRKAVAQKKSLGEVVEDALRIAFVNRSKKSTHIRLITAKGAGLKPGVDLDDSRSLLEIMEK
jgi:hypothetical protein